MQITLGLVRHGRATGQGPESDLLPEGAGYVATLGRRLGREGWTPLAAFSSPYLRARETARILLGELASDLRPVLLPELTPDQEPERTLDALLWHKPPAGRVLVVAHMPLLGRLADLLTEEPVEFYPGTFVEVVFDAATRRGSVVRRIGPDDL
jgi:phosphohistidine phosphatase SixA